ncbi:MAG TPA: hypothetical protein VJO12_13015 [Stellaceae bacterium]|nr:hypothetical protein [Stellaceae bacterium]
MSKRHGERRTPQIVAAALILSSLVAACSSQNRSTEGAGTTVAPNSESALAIDQPVYVQPVYVQRYPCGGAQAKCWGAPSW